MSGAGVVLSLTRSVSSPILEDEVFIVGHGVSLSYESEKEVFRSDSVEFLFSKS